MSATRLLIGLLAVSAGAADARLDGLLKAVEGRYNRAKTLQVVFHEDYTPQGKPRRSESGTLLLRKPADEHSSHATGTPIAEARAP